MTHPEHPERTRAPKIEASPASFALFLEEAAAARVQVRTARTPDAPRAADEAVPGGLMPTIRSGVMRDA